MEYAFRTTYKENADAYVEDRGYPHYIRRGNETFDVLEEEFGRILQAGQTATRSEGRWWVEDGCPFLDAAKKEKLETLHDAWLEAEASGTVPVEGQDGWRADANDRANRDLNGLVTAMEELGIESAEFCGADNTSRELTLSQIKALRLQVIAHAQALYSYKWTKRLAIQAARTFDELNAVEINFGEV